MMRRKQDAIVEIWDKVLEVLEKEWNRRTYIQWLRNIYPLSFEENVFCVAVPNDFVKDWLVKRYARMIEAFAREVVGGEVSVEFKVVPGEVAESVIPRPMLKPQPVQSQAASFHQGRSRDEFTSLPLNQKYTFENFVVGRSNQFTHAAAWAVANSPATQYNPLFIYGDVGVGKTHLMQAIGHKVLENNPQAEVIYVSGETFLYHVVTSIREDRTAAFRRLYRNVDLWLVDDIQYIAARERTEEEFFHIFNALHQTNKQIVICSDRPPKDLQIMENRLLSRFEMGLITDIGLPDLEHRIAILERKALADGVLIPDEVIRYIAERMKTNIRVLEGALTRVLAYTSLTNSRLTVETAAEALKDYSTGEGTTALTIEAIQKAVCDAYNISVSDLTGPRRTKSLVLPRQIAMFLAKELTGASFPEIGKAFGGKDHTTVMYSCQKIEAQLSSDGAFRKSIDALKAKIKG